MSTARLPIGGTFVDAARTYRVQSWRVLGIALLLLVPAELLAFAGEWADHQWDGKASSTVIWLAVALGDIVLSNIGAAFYIGLVDHTVHAARHGHEPPSVGEVARRLPYWRMIAVVLVAGLLAAGGFVLLILPGLALTTLFAIAAPVVVIEGATVRGALRRSWQLVRPQFWRVFLVVTIPVLGEGAVVDGILGLTGHGHLPEFLVHGLLGTILYAYVLLLEVHTAHWLIDDARP